MTFERPDSADLPLAGRIVARNHEGWTDEVKAEFADNEFNGRVGQVLLAQTARARIWEIKLEPGARVPAHRHVLDYFWTALRPGRSRQHTHDGTTREVTYRASETRHFSFGQDEYLLHDLENLGAEPLHFITVEFLESTNQPLTLAD